MKTWQKITIFTTMVVLIIGSLFSQNFLEKNTDFMTVEAVKTLPSNPIITTDKFSLALNKQAEKPAYTTQKTYEITQLENLLNVEDASHIKIASFRRYIYKFYTELPYICVTFDDCPSGDMDGILDLLKRYNMRATFFVMGTLVQVNGQHLQRIIDEGHTIGNHSYNHPNFTTISKDMMINQLKFTDNLVYERVKINMILFRPPYGGNNSTVNLVAYSQGYSVVEWSVDSSDYSMQAMAAENSSVAE